MSPIRSRKYLDGARGATCKLRIVGVCTGDRETTVAAHIRDRHTGRGVKASDVSIVDACFACHCCFDGQGTHVLNREDWLFYALRGLQETLEDRIERGIIVVSKDAKAPRQASKKPRPKMQSRNQWPQGRKIPSRPFAREKA